MSDPLGKASESLARLRGARAFHPHGLGFSASFEPVSGCDVDLPLLNRGPRPAQVRISRGLGLPEPLPDFFGFALRVPDAHGRGWHQDFLLASGSARPLLRHFLFPTTGFGPRPFTSLAPYLVQEQRTVILAVPERDEPPLKLSELDRREADGIRVPIAFSSPGRPRCHVADVVLGERLAPDKTEAIGFDPSTTGGGLELTGLINRFRPPAYRGSRSGRGVT